MGPHDWVLLGWGVLRQPAWEPGGVGGTGGSLRGASRKHQGQESPTGVGVGVRVSCQPWARGRVALEGRKALLQGTPGGGELLSL